MADLVAPTKRPITPDPMLVHGAETSNTPGRTAPLTHDHLVRFYEDDDGLAGAVASFLAKGARGGDTLTVIATEKHRDAFRAHLEAGGVPVAQLVATGQLTFLDAHDTLASFMRDGQPDRALFEAHVGGLIAKQTSNMNARLRAYGEMVDVLWAEGKRTAALRLEELWNELQGRHPFTLLCAYSMASFYKEPSALQHVCATHTHVIAETGHEDVEDVRPTELPPQYARQLAREIEKRAEIEQALRDSMRELLSHESVFINDTITRLNPLYVPARRPAERAARSELNGELNGELNDDALDALIAKTCVDV